MAELPLRLPSSLRQEFKSPFGPVYTDVNEFLIDADQPIIAVGDIVTYHLRMVDYTSAVAIIDGQTKRETVDKTISTVLSEHNQRIDIENPPGMISAALLEALHTAVSRSEPVTIVVEGEEDLATLPAVLISQLGGTVVYGQPGQGMVRIPVTAETKIKMERLLNRMDGDATAVFDRLGVDRNIDEE
jgi:Uncharacterized protein conserved in archaea